MIRLFLRPLVSLFLFVMPHWCCGQGDPVVWRFEAAPVKGQRTSILITAHLAPGWHLYSQYVKEGGPIPTKFTFDPGKDYILSEGIREKGNYSKKFYDDIYEMEITWYTGIVSFEQGITLNKPGATVKGRVEYMTCNSHVCIPAEREFSVKVNP